MIGDSPSIDHLGIAVADLDAALSFYRGVLGLPSDPIEAKGELGLRIARVRIGSVVLELIEARDWNRTTQRYLPRQGPGVYHLGLAVADVDGRLARLRETGTGLIDAVPRAGDGMRVAFVHPDATAGTLVELVMHQTKPA